jgi:hypothetical protein
MLTISKKWNRPEIRTALTGEGIILQMQLPDFLVALKQEVLSSSLFDGATQKLQDHVGPVKFIVSEKVFQERLDRAVRILTDSLTSDLEKCLDNAFIEIVTGIKEESRKVIE